MAEKLNIEWGRQEYAGLLARWPKDENGVPEEPVLLCKLSALDMSDELMLNMLEAYGIPCLRRYPGDGAFGKLVLGMSGEGTEIYVPKSLYIDAKELSKGAEIDEEL